MFSRSLMRTGAWLSRQAEFSLMPRFGLQSSSFAMSSEKQPLSEQEKFLLKNSSGSRISGSEYRNLVRENADPSNSSSEKDQFEVPVAAFDALLKEYDDLVGEVKSLDDKYRRALAEMENVRRRGAKQVDDAKLFAIQGFCKDLLEVADILDLAISSVKEDDLIGSSKGMKDFYQGVSMTKAVLLKTFAKNGLRPNTPIGEKFDPNFHEAVYQVSKDQAKQEVGSVEHVMKMGYNLHGRAIRPAQVGVVKD